MSSNSVHSKHIDFMFNSVCTDQDDMEITKANFSMNAQMSSCGYYSGTLSFILVTATDLNIEYP